MAVYKETCTITQRRSDYIKKCLTSVELTEDEILIDDVTFSNGFLMEVKCCGSQEEPAWTEAVLFRKTAGGAYAEVTCSEVSDEYLGEWEVEYDGDKYVVKVVEQ